MREDAAAIGGKGGGGASGGGPADADGGRADGGRSDGADTEVTDFAIRDVGSGAAPWKLGGSTPASGSVSER